MILPDTNILIAYFENEEPIISIVQQSILEKKIILSVISITEFLIKAASRQASLLNDIAAEIGITYISRPILDQAVKYRKQTLQKSKRVYLLDCYIAATAKVSHATLLTFNRHDYPFSDLTVRQPEEIKDR